MFCLSFLVSMMDLTRYYYSFGFIIKPLLFMNKHTQQINTLKWYPLLGSIPKRGIICLLFDHIIIKN